MPRVRSLDPHQVILERLTDSIRGAMRRQNIKQSQMAAELGVTQQAFSRKLRTNSLTGKDLIIIFDFLNINGEEAGNLLCQTRKN